MEIRSLFDDHIFMWNDLLGVIGHVSVVTVIVCKTIIIALHVLSREAVASMFLVRLFVSLFVGLKHRDTLDRVRC